MLARALGAALVLAGCGEDGGAGGAGGAVGQIYDITTGPVTIASGEERIVCVDKRLPTTTPLDLVRITSDLSEGGHHLIFYKSGATVESLAPFPCQTFRDIFQGTLPLYIAQKAQTELDFPRGVAYSLPPRQMVRIELHFLNATSAPLTVQGAVHLGDAARGTVSDHANLMFWGRVDIDIPPGQSGILGPSFHLFKQTAPKIFGLTGHTHRLGTGVLIEVARDVDGPGTLVYENHNWAEPPLKLIDPPLEPIFGDGFRFTCTYNNTTAQTVRFGEMVGDEMCFLWAYYFPDEGFDAFACPLGQITSCTR